MLRAPDSLSGEPSEDASSGPVDADEDAFSDDSGTYMEDIMMLRADHTEQAARPDSGGTATGSRTWGGTDSSVGGGGAASSGGGGSVSGAMSMEEEEEEEEFSEPGEDALVDDETTLAEVNTRAVTCEEDGRDRDSSACAVLLVPERAWAASGPRVASRG